MTIGGRCAVPEGRREGVMCACGARPGSEGPHVGGMSEADSGSSTLLIFPASRQKGNIHHGHE